MFFGEWRICNRQQPPAGTTIGWSVPVTQWPAWLARCYRCRSPIIWGFCALCRGWTRTCFSAICSPPNCFLVSSSGKSTIFIKLSLLNHIHHQMHPPKIIPISFHSRFCRMPIIINRNSIISEFPDKWTNNSCRKLSSSHRSRRRRSNCLRMSWSNGSHSSRKRRPDWIWVAPPTYIGQKLE